MEAALASGGASSDPIYSAVLMIADELGLHGSVLDYGAGKGNLTRLLYESGKFSEVSAADILPRPAIAEAIRWFALDLNDLRFPVEDAFDAVVAAEVIEHLENPRAMMRSVFRALKPGGTAIITTPNCENIRGYLSLLARRHFWAFTDSSYPAHLTALLEQDLRRVAKEAGFTEMWFDYRLPGGIPRRPRLQWQQISIRLSGRLFCDNVVMIARKGVG